MWGLTIREYNALKAVAGRDHELQMQVYGGLQATLHNAHFPRKGNPWKPEDFLGRKKPQTVEEKKRAIGTLFGAARDFFRNNKRGVVQKSYTDYNDPINS